MDGSFEPQLESPFLGQSPYWETSKSLANSRKHRGSAPILVPFLNAGFPLRLSLCYGPMVLEQLGVLFQLLPSLPSADFSPQFVRDMFSLQILTFSSCISTSLR